MSSKWCFCVHLYLFAVVTRSAEWFSPSSRMVYSDKESAVGAHEDTIFILGGSSNKKQMTEYHIPTDTFTLISATFLSTDLEAFGQLWTQIGELMYILEADGGSLSTFDMANKQYNPSSITLPITAGSKCCVASSNDRLFITGAEIPNNVLRILDIATSQWSTESAMSETRRCHACVVHNNYLWAFAGWNNERGIRLSVNERISITGIGSNDWAYIGSLTSAHQNNDPYVLRAVASQNSIFIIGGYLGSGLDQYLDRVYIADAVTGAVTLSGDALPYGIANFGIVLTHDIIYIFGGLNNGGSLNTWIKCELSTTSTTVKPSQHPTTAIPSVNPSKHPTTAIPSIHPSKHPTSANPSAHPTTVIPSEHPTTAVPSVNPSEPPTTAILSANQMHPIPTEKPVYLWVIGTPTHHYNATIPTDISDPLLNDKRSTPQLALWQVYVIVILVSLLCVICVCSLGISFYYFCLRGVPSQPKEPELMNGGVESAVDVVSESDGKKGGEPRSKNVVVHKMEDSDSDGMWEPQKKPKDYVTGTTQTTGGAGKPRSKNVVGHNMEESDSDSDGMWENPKKKTRDTVTGTTGGHTTKSA